MYVEHIYNCPCVRILNCVILNLFLYLIFLLLCMCSIFLIEFLICDLFLFSVKFVFLLKGLFGQVYSNLYCRVDLAILLNWYFKVILLLKTLLGLGPEALGAQHRLSGLVIKNSGVS